MPFKSRKQQKYMWMMHPDIAKRWAAEGKGYVAGKGKKKSRKSASKHR